MRSLTADDLRRFGADGYVVVKGVVDESFLPAADKEIDALIATEPPVPGVPERPFWFPPPTRLRASDAALRESGALVLAEQLVAPLSLENAVDLGALDQFADSTDVLSYRERSAHLRAMYQSQTT